jgi:hypothetical protein
VFGTELYRQFFGLTAPWKVAEVNRRRIDAAPRPRRRGRRPVQADQGPLAHPSRTSLRSDAPSCGSFERRTASRPGLVHREESAAPLVLPSRRLVWSLLRRLACLGGPQPPRAGQGRRSDAGRTARKREHLQPPSNHQRRRRGTREHDHGSRAAGRGLQEPWQLENRHRRPLRWATPSLMPIPDGPDSRSRVGMLISFPRGIRAVCALTTTPRRSIPRS